MLRSAGVRPANWLLPVRGSRQAEGRAPGVVVERGHRCAPVFGGGAVDQSAGVDVAGQGTEDVSPPVPPLEAGPGERVRDRGMAEPHEKGALQNRSHVAHDAASAVLQRVRVGGIDPGQAPFESGHCVVEVPVCARRALDFVEEDAECLGLPGEGAQASSAATLPELPRSTSEVPPGRGEASGTLRRSRFPRGTREPLPHGRAPRLHTCTW